MTPSIAPLLAFSLAIASLTAAAQSYPVKPVRLVVGFSAGGSVDIVARLLGQKLSEALGQQFIIDNRAGAAGNIAADHVAKAAPDGYTLLLSSATPLAAGISIYKKLPFDPRRDFAPIVLVVHQHMVVTVHPSVPVKTVKELVALAKAQPGKLNYGTSGVGGGHHLRAVQFIMYTGVDIVPVAYRGGAQATVAQLSGEIELMFDTVPTTIEHIQTGRVRALAVMSPQRVGKLPNVPTLHEAGLTGFDSRSWMAISAPAGTPKDVIVKLNAVVNEVLRGADLRGRLEDLGLEVAGGTTEELLALIRKEIDLYARIVKASGMPLQ